MTRAIVALSLWATALTCSAQTLRIGVSTLAPEKANPYQGITLPAVVPNHAIFDSLTALDSDGNVIPQLAIRWTTNDATVWRFDLREDVVFSNGEPFDAQAIVTSVAHMRSDKGKTETIGSTLYQIERVEVISDLIVDVHLNEPDALFPLHASVWRIPAPGAWRELGLPAFGSAPAGTGSFQLVEWNDQRATLVANPRAWRPPKLEGIEFIRVADEATRFQGLISGALDMALELAPENRAAIGRTGGRIALRLTPSVHFLGFITENDSPVRDVRVRRALNHAVNREAIIEFLLDGATTPASQLAFPGSFGYDETLEPYAYDPEKARALLREAGFAEGLELTVMVSIVGGNDAAYYQQIAADLAEVGVTVDLQARPRALLISNLFLGELEGDLFNLLVRGHDPLTAYRHRACLSLTVQRAPYHCDPALIPMLEAARGQTDAEAALPYYKRVLAHEHENPPGLLLWQAPAFDGLAQHVKGYAPVQDVINFHELTIER